MNAPQEGQMRIQDQIILALCVWRENRGGGRAGMQSVANVIVNRAARRKSNAYTECVRRLQFSSLTAKGDPELIVWPADDDAQWMMALEIAGEAASGVLVDITGGADLYYAPRSIRSEKVIGLPDGSVIPFPDDWNEKVVTYTGTIETQAFFRQDRG
jgi:hypothetical protein